ncbi:hypothetical protein D3C76_1123010 [compost metagenome]
MVGIRRLDFEFLANTGTKTELLHIQANGSLGDLVALMAQFFCDLRGTIASIVIVIVIRNSPH